MYLNRSVTELLFNVNFVWGEVREAILELSAHKVEGGEGGIFPS